MAVKRPSYIPERLDWFVDEPLSNRKITFREGQQTDQVQIRDLVRECGLRPSAKRLYEWFSRSNYLVMLACRNLRTVVGVCIADHRPGLVSILALHVCEQYSMFPIDEKLLQLARLELPEAPTRISVLSSDDVRMKRLRQLGWRCVEQDADGQSEDEARATFEIRFASAPESHPAERDQPVRGEDRE